MTNKPHVKLNTSKQHDQPVKLKFNYGFGEEEDGDEDEPKSYFSMAHDFRSFLSRFNADYRVRIEQRNQHLQIPAHIEYIHVLFQSQFVISEFYSQWFNEFGLLGVHFSKFNSEVLFSIADYDKFILFIDNITNFITKESGENVDAKYSKKIIYIKEFKLLTTADVIQFRTAGALMNVRLVDDLPLGDAVFRPILAALQNYLDNNHIGWTLTEESKNIEIINASEAQIVEIVRNFDIVLSVTSSLSTVVRPSDLNLPERSYGFEIVNVDEGLPIVGLLDTGISNQTPLAPLLINDQSFNLTGTSVFEDNVNHGTAVAALAALGKRAYLSKFRGQMKPDAKLLSIKILDNASAYVSQKAILELLTRAKKTYPSIKIFVLTICYQIHKRNNEDFSSYAFELDKFAHENDCLISICTGNNDEAAISNTSYDLNYFFTETTNLCTPAESMNNITVGAAAYSLRDGNFEGISTSKEFPTLYTRKSHFDLSLLFAKNKINKLYFKPDVIDCGGDYEYSRSNSFIGAGTKASMEVLSSNPAESFYGHVGTSFSAPLVANIAVQLQKNYPDIKAQSIKALIINGSSLNLVRFQKPFAALLNKTAGHGITNEARSNYSNDNAITFLLEDEIEPELTKIFPIHFPKYLIEDDLGKKNGILKVTATLCFSFLPVPNHQLGYCPIHMAFCFFKNQTGDEIQATDDEIKSLLKSDLRWSQSGRHKSKPMPYTNTQKISFPVNVQNLIDEESTFKLAVQCRINPQLLSGVEKQYERAHKFSLAISIEEKLKDGMLTGKLYQEMSLCNSIENIAADEIEVDETVELRAEI